MNKKAKFGSFVACIYAAFQIVLLFFLRKLYLLTVYQTVAFYGAISLAGIALLCISKYLLRKEEQKPELPDIPLLSKQNIQKRYSAEYYKSAEYICIF